MKTASVEQNLIEAEQVGRRILALADTSDWEQLAVLEPRWDELVRQCFTGGQSIEYDQAVKLKQLNDAIIDRLTFQRGQLVKAKMQLKQGSKASRAYLANASE